MEGTVTLKTSLLAGLALLFLSGCGASLDALDGLGGLDGLDDLAGVVIETSPESLDFGEVPAGTTESLELVIENTTDEEIHLGAIEVRDDEGGVFAFTGEDGESEPAPCPWIPTPCPLLPGSGTLELMLGFTAPESPGEHTGSLAIEIIVSELVGSDEDDDDVRTTVDVPLRGTSVAQQDGAGDK